MWLAWLLLELTIVAAAVWLGAQIAQIEYADFSRCFTVAAFAVVFSFVFSLIFNVIGLFAHAPVFYALG